MTIDTLIILAGALVALLPFLGFPTNWDTALFFILGVFVIALGVVIRRRGGLPFSQKEKRQNAPQSSDSHEVA